MTDPIAGFYERHPYPPPVSDLASSARDWEDGTRRRIEHHRRWPTLSYRDDHSILVAGCGTSQAARYAIRYPRARVVGIDVSPTSIAHSRLLSDRHDLDNLDVKQLEIERAAELGHVFDHVVCTGVIHHLADPGAGLRALRDVLAPGGTLDLMVYARFGRTGVEMIQSYCRLLGVEPNHEDIADLVATLRELPVHHPLSPILRNTPDFADDDALADALLNPRERSYSVPEVFDLLEASGLSFDRWLRQAPYSPAAGAISGTPHGARIASLDETDQYEAVELFRGTMTRHSLIARRDDEAEPRWRVFDDVTLDDVPIREATSIAVTDRLPDGAAAALLNQAHSFADLVLFVDEAGRRQWDAIDDRRTIGEMHGDPEAVGRLWEHDLIVIDASRS